MLLRSPLMVAIDARNSFKVERLEAMEADILSSLEIDVRPLLKPKVIHRQNHFAKLVIGKSMTSKIHTWVRSESRRPG